MTKRTTITMVTTLALLFGAGAVHAKNPCIGDAKGQYKDCKADCKETFQVAKDACLDRDHDCVEVCRADREQCRIDSGFDGLLDACENAFAAARQQCKNTTTAGTPQRDACIDVAQVAAFQCRDNAREATKGKLKQCRRDFQACASACPPGAGPVEDPKLCKGDAKTAYKTCQEDCREDLQVQKDACRNLDHPCVEQCRAEREACKDLVRGPLGTAIAACNAERDLDVQACKNLYAAGSPERDQCIDAAQVEAFICRDDAREAALPGKQACRAQFRTCLEGCPSASPSGAFVE